MVLVLLLCKIFYLKIPMTIRNSEPSSKLQGRPKRAAIRENVVGILRLLTVPTVVVLAAFIPDLIVKWGNFTTNLMELDAPAKTEILRKVFETCGKEEWKACDNYDADRWAAESYIYLDVAERFGPKLRKTVAQIFRPAYLRTSLYESLSGPVKNCMSLMGRQLSTVGKARLDYQAFLTQYNELNGVECQYLHAAFVYPTFSDDQVDPGKAILRRIGAIEHLTEALALKEDSKIPAIRARLSAIQRNTLAGLAGTGAADLAARTNKLNEDVGAIQSMLYGLRDNKTSTLEMEQAEEEAWRGRIKTGMLLVISFLLIALNWRKLLHSASELWMIVMHGGHS